MGVIPRNNPIRGAIDRREGSIMPGNIGNVYYVDGVNGSASATGKTADDPLLTLTAALALVTDQNHDYIFILDYWRPSGETWPWNINKDLVHIIGVGGAPGLPWPAIHPSTDVEAIQLTSSGQYIEIAGLTIGGGASHGGIDWQDSGQVDGAWIHHNVFGHQWFGTPLNAIRQAATASRGGYGNVIEDNVIMGDLANCTGAITGNGIDMLGAVMSYDLTIRRNRFMGCAININLTKVSNGMILDNKFICADAADGEAVSLLTACRGCMVDGNVAMNGGDAAMTKEPYRDVAATNNNQWGVNWTTNAVDLPKQT